MRTLVIKGAAGIVLAALTLVCGSIPGLVREMALVATLFITLDTATGFVAAAASRNVSSHTMRLRLLFKTAQYALLVGLGAGVAILAHSWLPIAASLSAIVGIETVSMCENLTRLEQSGGVPLGPVRPLIQRLARYLTAGLPEAEALLPPTGTVPVAPAEGDTNVRSDSKLDIQPGAAPIEREREEVGGADKAEPGPDRGA